MKKEVERISEEKEMVVLLMKKRELQVNFYRYCVLIVQWENLSQNSSKRERYYFITKKPENLLQIELSFFYGKKINLEGIKFCERYTSD